MAELSNDGSGVLAVTCSASTLPCAPRQRHPDRLDRADGREHVGQVLLDGDQRRACVGVRPGWLLRGHCRLSRNLRSQGTNSAATSGRSTANWIRVRR